MKCFKGVIINGHL